MTDVLELAAFLGVAWLLSVGVDRCYRRTDASHRAARAPRDHPEE